MKLSDEVIAAIVSGVWNIHKVANQDGDFYLGIKRFRTLTWECMQDFRRLKKLKKFLQDEVKTKHIYASMRTPADDIEIATAINKWCSENNIFIMPTCISVNKNGKDVIDRVYLQVEK